MNGSYPLPEPARAEEPREILADGRLREVDPKYIAAERLSGCITTGVVCGGLLAGVILGWVSVYATSIAMLLLGAWAGIAGLLMWLTLRYPEWAYARLRYRVSPDGIEIRWGVIFRHVADVARSRVQHTDVAQGPILRRYGLAKLVIHTAGTSFSTVELNGLALETAFRLRDFLIDETRTNDHAGA